jgi:hypothetical protein
MASQLAMNGWDILSLSDPRAQLYLTGAVTQRPRKFFFYISDDGDIWPFA